MRDVNVIALLLCNLFLRAQQASFSSKPPHGIIKARIGEDVTLNWNFTMGDGDKLVIMQLEYSKTDQFGSSPKRIAYRVGDNPFIFDSSAFRVSVAITGALTLYNVSVDQRGFYRFTASLVVQNHYFSDKVQLFVGLPPVIYSSLPSHITLLEDEHVDISCVARGSPDPIVSWYRQSQHGWKKLSEDRLQIKNVKVSDSGSYSCRARNFMDSAERTVELAVYERPGVSSFFHTAALDDTVYECEAITFTCEARANSLPVKNIYIYHEDRRRINTDRPTLLGGNKTLVAGGRMGRLRIAEVRKEHKGRYYCVAENEHGFGYNKTIDLKVLDAPKNCERKRTLQTTSTTKRQTDTSVSPTVSDRSIPTTTNDTSQGLYSSSQVVRPSLLLFTTWIFHLMFCNVFS